MGQPIPSDHRAKSVLLVDDDEELREALADLLMVAGRARDCVALGSLAECQARADEVLACDLAILDVNLGEGLPNGTDVCYWLRERLFAGVIVFLTGHAASDARVRAALAIPQTRLMQKPIETAMLLALLAEPAPAA